MQTTEIAGDIQLIGCIFHKVNGVLHNNDGPAVIYYKGGKVTEEIWFCRGLRHRVGGPAEVHYKNGQIIHKEWYYEGKLHRIGAPAVKSYKNGRISIKNYYNNGELCGAGVLASVIYYVDFETRPYYWTGRNNTNNKDGFRSAVRGDAIHDVLRPLPIPIREEIIWHYCYQ